MIFDERGRGSAGAEFRVFQHIKREAYIRFDASDTRFSQTACELVDGGLVGQGRRRDLREHRVVVRRDDRAREGVAAVHADAEALARAPELDAADVGPEVFFRVFGRHARLDRVASYLNVVLGVQTDLRQRLALGHADLRLPQVDTRHYLRDRVFHLDP